ncbi:hypothetical protein AYP77_02955 [Lactobacillus crispatus]|uniref:hypothetical protein n=1 Tax=Lactobacillus crispatus TaxID=47770 RepID=UPI000B5D96CF|nr:hypothetical protein [Lactobacillus crispatus]OXC12316.1 hypothetical protein AYP77_02955 [Lactobacillus crispatus]
MNNDINQDVKQDAPVTDNQTTPVTPVAPAVPDSVKLDLSADQAEMVQDLLSNFVYAYRSDREVDCKRELVRRDQVGKYPYIAEAPDPSIINPIYDWVGKKWYSKTGATSLPEIAQSVANLNKKSTEQDQAALANGQQMQMITKQLGNQMTMMKQMQQTLTILAKGSQAQPTAPTVNTDTNGGNN